MINYNTLFTSHDLELRDELNDRIDAVSKATYWFLNKYIHVSVGSPRFLESKGIEMALEGH